MLDKIFGCIATVVITFVIIVILQLLCWWLKLDLTTMIAITALYGLVSREIYDTNKTWKN